MFRQVFTTAVCGSSLFLLNACTSNDSPPPGGMLKPSSASMESGEAAAPNKQMQAVLDKLTMLNPKPIESLTPADARKQPAIPDAVKAILVGKGMPTQMPIGKVEARKIAGPGGELPVRIYTPAGDGPFPVLVYYHGGGWVIASVDAYDSSARALANASKRVVVSVEYRLAPEHKFPAAVDDAYAAYKWARENAASFNGDPADVAVGGESAGGNLALVTSMQARDKKFTPPTHQLLVYPVAGTNLDVPSAKTYANAKPLNTPMLKWFLGYYLSNPESDGKSPYVSPVTADLSNLPPATVIAAEIDPLLSGVLMVRDKLEQAGNKVRFREYRAVTHEFFGIGPILNESVDAVKFASDGLKGAKPN